MPNARELGTPIQARVGTTIRGKYRLECLLGVGSTAAVYRASNFAVQRVCAIKILHHELAVIEEVRSRFLREGRAANAVAHPCVVDVLDSDVTEDDSAYLVMEFLEGQSIEAIRRATGRVALQTALTLGYHLLDVLHAAHSKGIVHRDIKPANLFVTKQKRLKVVDFGIARLREGSSGVDLTRTGVVLGTPAFMAPEQALGITDEVGPKSDVYAAGATLLTLLTNRFVHEAKTAPEMMAIVATRPAPPVLSVAPHLPDAIAAVLDRALCFEAEERWADARSMRDAISSAYVTLFGEHIDDTVAVPLDLDDEASAKVKSTTSIAVSVAPLPPREATASSALDAPTVRVTNMAFESSEVDPAVPSPDVGSNTLREPVAGPDEAPMLSPRQPLTRSRTTGIVIGAMMAVAAVLIVWLAGASGRGTGFGPSEDIVSAAAPEAISDPRSSSIAPEGPPAAPLGALPSTDTAPPPTDTASSPPNFEVRSPRPLATSTRRVAPRPQRGSPPSAARPSATRDPLAP